MSDVHKELRKVINTLDKWLGGLHKSTLDLQKELLRTKGSKPPQEAEDSINALIGLTAQLKTHLEGEIESLTILSRSPPGWTASIIDFLYAVTIDPKAPSQKKEYLDKLKKLDTAINKGVDTFGEEDPSFNKRIQDKVGQIVASWKLERNEVDQANLEKEIGSQVISIIRTPKENISQKLEDLLAKKAKIDLKKWESLFRALEPELLSMVSMTSKLEGRFRVIKEELYRRMQTASSLLTIKHAALSQKEVISLIQTYAEKFKKFKEMLDAKIINNQMNNALSGLGANASTKEIDIIQKYIGYVNLLLDPRKENGLTQYVKSIANTLQILESFLSFSSGSSLQSQAPTKGPKEETKDSKDDKNMLDGITSKIKEDADSARTQPYK
jgi:hypothetical protein